MTTTKLSIPTWFSGAPSTGAPSGHSHGEAHRAPLASFVDPRSGLRLEFHRPLEAPERWQDYLDGAEARYRADGFEEALRRPQLEDGRSTSLFFVAVDDNDHVVGGIRCHGPLRATSEAYALQELADHPQLQLVRDTLDGCIGFGLVEMKGAWIASNSPRPGLGSALARCIQHSMNWFGARFALCSTEVVTGARWRTTGGRPLEGFAPLGYPDDRYQTTLLWWDRDRNEELCDADQWTLIVEETKELAGAATGGAWVAQAAWSGRPAVAPASSAAWHAEVFDERDATDRTRLAELRADASLVVINRFDDQIAALRRMRPLPAKPRRDESPRWVYYPWRRCLIRLLGPAAFRALRLDRNRNKITLAEQEKLGSLRVGVVGLSVGHSIAYLLALEGSCGELRLADFDTVELSNLNRIPASVLDLGVNKAVAVGRRISELDPYLSVQLVERGLNASTIDEFVGGLDVVIEECDSLDMKVMVREAARRSRVAVIMDTSDRGLLDVERFDLEPNRPLFHGLLGDVRASDLVGLSTHDKVPYVLRLLEPAQLSSRMAASMAEIDETVTTWPQLGGDVFLGAATIASAIRRIGRGEPLASGRVRVDLAEALDALAEPDLVDSRPTMAAAVPAPPTDPGLAVAYAATLAPSGGNSQPWSLRLDADRLNIYVDRSHTVRMNVRYRGTYVSSGAALFNARVAAAAHGILGPVELFPDGEESDLVSIVNFEPDGTGRSDRPNGGPADADAALGALYPGVLSRCTNRMPGRAQPLDDALVSELHRQAALEGGRLHLLTSTDVIEDYAELLGESDRLRFLSPILHGEMMRELSWPGEDPLDRGIDVRTLELDESDLSKMLVARRPDVMADLAAWDGGRALGEITRDRVRQSSAIAVLTVAGTSRQAYVGGGGALQRLWLAAEAAGLAVQPVSPLSVYATDSPDFASLVPAPYVPRLEALSSRLWTLAHLGDDEAVILVLRFSHSPPPTTRSLRRSLQSVLLSPTPAS